MTQPPADLREQFGDIDVYLFDQLLREWHEDLDHIHLAGGVWGAFELWGFGAGL